MSKIYNTHEYRKAKRIAAFIDPKVKKLVEKQAKDENRSVSYIIGMALDKYYGVKK